MYKEKYVETPEITEYFRKRNAEFKPFDWSPIIDENRGMEKKKGQAGKGKRDSRKKLGKNGEKVM